MGGTANLAVLGGLSAEQAGNLPPSLAGQWQSVSGQQFSF